jgi:RNA polymerase sigma-70 factor (ECF subfamily)
VRQRQLYAACLAHREEVYAFVRRLAGPGPDADDLLQETYATAFTAWRDLRDATRARAWLFTIARRTFVDRLRRAARERRLSVLDGGEAREPAVAPGPFSLAEVEHALRTLPEEMATAVVLCDLWGFRYREIAEILDCPLGTVRSRVARGRTQLAERLSGRSRGRRQEDAP